MQAQNPIPCDILETAEIVKETDDFAIFPIPKNWIALQVEQIVIHNEILSLKTHWN